MKKRHILALILPLTFTQAFAAIEPEIYVGGMMNFNYLMTDQDSNYSQEFLPVGFNSSSNANNLSISSGEYTDIPIFFTYPSRWRF